MSVPRRQDWDEHEDGDERSHGSQPAKRLRCSGCCDDRQMELLEVMRRMIQGQNEKIESLLREIHELKEKVCCLTADISRLDGSSFQQSSAPRVLSDEHYSIPFRLKFLNSCKNDKYSTRKIEADDEASLKVAIYDQNNKIITSEPFSSMRVQIVAIHGDFDHDHKGQWTTDYFLSKIVTGRAGKEQLLTGDLYIRLQDGVGYLNTAKFQDNSSFVASKRFKLGVMAADERISQRIQEGITESFAVKDVRGYSTKKKLNPSPCDPVYKLNRIAMHGDRHKLLEQNRIKTVEDFLLSYIKSPGDLRKILGKISDQEWDVITDHAQKCNLKPQTYSSYIQEKNMPYENGTTSKSDGSCYLQGSSSLQPSPAPQNVHATPQPSSSTYNGLSSVGSLENVLGEPEGVQVAPEQVSAVGNDVLSVQSVDNNTIEGCSSKQGRSSECDTMHHNGSVLPHASREWLETDFQRKLSEMEAALMSDNSDIPGENTCGLLGGPCSAFEDSSASEADSSGSHKESSRSPAVRGSGSRSSRARGPSSSPAMGKRGRRCLFRGEKRS